MACMSKTFGITLCIFKYSVDVVRPIFIPLSWDYHVESVVVYVTSVEPFISYICPSSLVIMINKGSLWLIYYYVKIGMNIY